MAGFNNHLDIDKIMSPNNLAAKVKIYASGTPSVGISGILTGDFSFGIGSEYTSLFDVSQIDDLSQVVNRLTSVVNAYKERFNIKAIPQLRLKSPGLTTKVFSGTKDIRFSVDVIFLSLRQGDDVIDKVQQLARLCMPTIQNVERAGIGVYEAPLGYSTEVLTKTSNGPVAVQIGGWFSAHGMIVHDVHFNMSRVGSDENGTPLFVTANIQFGPTIEIGLGEFKNYFLSSSGKSVAGGADADVSGLA